MNRQIQTWNLHWHWISALILIAAFTRFDAAHAQSTVTIPDAEQASANNAQETTGITSKEIVIGSCLPLTGNLAQRGKAISRAVNAYFSYINEQGGVNGRQLKLIDCDDAFDPERAITCFNTCLKGKVFAGGFFIGAPVIAKYVRMADLHAMPLVGFNVGIPTLCDLHPTQFNLQPCYDSEVHKLLAELVGRNIRRIAIIYQSDAFGASIRRAVLQEMAKLHMAPISEASCTRGQSEIEAAYQQVKASKPQAVILAAGTKTLSGVVQARAKDNPHAIFASISTLADALLIEGKQSDGFVVTQVLPPLNSKLPGIELYEKLLKKYYPDSQPHLHGFEAFLNARVLVEGIKRAGPGLTRSKLVHSLETLRDYDLGLGITRKVTFTSSKHVAWSDDAVDTAIIRNNKLEPLSASELQQLAERAKNDR